MEPKDFIYKEAFKQFMALGYKERDAETVGADSVRRWRRNTKAMDAIKQAIQLGKKSAVK